MVLTKGSHGVCERVCIVYKKVQDEQFDLFQQTRRKMVAKERVSHWLAAFERTLQDSDLDAVMSLFGPDCRLRNMCKPTQDQLANTGIGVGWSRSLFEALLAHPVLQYGRGGFTGRRDL